METLRSKNLQTVLLISLGAVLGANLRYWFGLWAGQRWGTQYPYATLLINLTGSFILGLFIALISDRVLVDPRWRTFIASAGTISMSLGSASSSILGGTIIPTLGFPSLFRISAVLVCLSGLIALIYLRARDQRSISTAQEQIICS